MMRMRARAGGFTLVEVLVATTILGIGVVSLLEAISSASSTVAKSREVTLASSLAKSRMEETLSEEELVLGSDSGTFDEPFDRFAWDSEISEGEEEGLQDWYHVKVKISWKAGEKGGSFEIETRKLKEMPEPVVPVVGAFPGESSGTNPVGDDSGSLSPSPEETGGDTDTMGFGSTPSSSQDTSNSDSGPESFFGENP